MNVSENLRNLYEELGGEKSAGEKIESILSGFYDTLNKDTMLGFFFAQKDLKHIVDQQKNFLLRAMGVNIKYTGRSVAQAHTKIPPILEGHFDRRLLLLREHLVKQKLSPSGIETWVEFENQFRRVIVSTKN